MDSHRNYAYSTVAVAPSPAISGLTLEVAAGEGDDFPDPPPFNVSIWPAGVQPRRFNAETARVTARVGDVFTLLRAQEGSSARAILVGDQIAASITDKMLDDLDYGAAKVGARIALGM